MGQCNSKSQGEAVISQEEALKRFGGFQEQESQKTIGTKCTSTASHASPNSWGSSHADDEESDPVEEDTGDDDNSSNAAANDAKEEIEFEVFSKPINTPQGHTLRSVVEDCDDMTFASTVAQSVATAKADNTRQQAQKRQQKNMDKLLRGTKKKTNPSRRNDLSSWGGLTSDDMISQGIPEDDDEYEEEDASDDGGMVWKAEDLNGSLRSISNGSSLLGPGEDLEEEEDDDIMWAPAPVRSRRDSRPQGKSPPKVPTLKKASDCKYQSEAPIWGSEDL